MENANNIISRKACLVMLLSLFVFSVESSQDNTKNNISNIDTKQLQAFKQKEKVLQIFNKEIQDLDKLSNILQSLGQAIQKNRIKVNNKKEVKDWALDCQSIIRDLKNRIKKEHELEELFRVGRLTQMLIMHITNIVESKFDQLPAFKWHTYPKKSIGLVSIEKIRDITKENGLLLVKLNSKSNETGLTTTNKICRYIDEVNDKYSITKIATNTVLIGALAVGVIYLLPDFLLPGMEEDKKIRDINDRSKYYQTLVSICSPLRWIKEKLGPQPTYDAAKNLTNAADLGIIGKVHDFSKNNKEVASFASTLGVLGGMAYGKELKELWTGAKRDWKDTWSQLKGYTIQEDKSAYKIIEGVTLEDEQLIGLEEGKDVLRKIARYIINPEIYHNTDSNPPKSILLTGPSGSGKTELARALNGTINEEMKRLGRTGKISFKSVKWDEVMYKQEGVATVIEEAQRNAPCVLFIDELHNLPLQANGYGKTLTEFLTALSGINDRSDSKHQVIILAATNRADLLDPALLRAGRFGDYIIRCEKPNYEQRKKYFEIMFKHNIIDSTDIDIDKLVRQTEGCTFVDLQAIIKDGKFNASIESRGLGQNHLQSKINTHVRRIKKDMPLTEQEKKIVAAHQAGHALLHMLPETCTNNKLQIATIHGVWPEIKEVRIWDTVENQKRFIKPKETQYGAVFTYNCAETIKATTNVDIIKQCKIKLAGNIAEQLLLGASSEYHIKDREKALGLLKKALLKGISEEKLSESKRAIINIVAERLLEVFEDIVHEIILENKERLEKIAKALEAKGTLEAEDIEDIINSVSKSQVVQNQELSEQEQQLREIAKQLENKGTLDNKQIQTVISIVIEKERYQALSIKEANIA